MDSALQLNGKLSEHFTPDQIMDIVSALENHAMIPHKHVYMANKEHFGKLEQETKYKTISNNNSKLLNCNIPLILETIQGASKLNIIDIGCGTGQVVKSFIGNLKNNIAIDHYFGLDASKEMATIASNNVHFWYADIAAHAISLDFDHEGFCEELSNALNESVGANDPKLFLYVGGTITNSLNPISQLQKIKALMGEKDLLLFSSALPVEPMCSAVSYIQEKKESYLTVPKLLGLKEGEDFNFKAYYDRAHHKKRADLIPNSDIDLDVRTSSVTRKVNLKKGYPVNLWFSQQYTVEEMLAQIEAAQLEHLQMVKLKNDYLIYFLCV